ncbi:hypothetical protein CDAR_15721 [Caerostris darwini]|uniref:Uncharacterized protein n=1 Tax=Caerostris darwini TaxID=1538125 RepID=A0AAV4N7A6_9ARAC|nr:hypothetical protein CDAR_15721 [Caerostris darwini]
MFRNKTKVVADSAILISPSTRQSFNTFDRRIMPHRKSLSNKRNTLPSICCQILLSVIPCLRRTVPNCLSVRLERKSPWDGKQSNKVAASAAETLKTNGSKGGFLLLRLFSRFWFYYSELSPPPRLFFHASSFSSSTVGR